MYKRWHKKALKAIDAPPSESQAPVPESLPVDPSTYTTVLREYSKRQSEFSGLASKAIKDRLLKEAGIKTSAEFRNVWGDEPMFAQERGFMVRAYPPKAEGVIVESLRDVYREILAGANQGSIKAFMFIRDE